MCGRYALFSPEETWLAVFGVASIGEFRPRYNIAPSQEVMVLRNDDGRFVADSLRWGLVPFWAKDPSIGNRMINARAETLAEKPSFRQALRRRRCLLPADGFFEWQATADGKQPWYISAADSRPLVFAGLWEEWQTPDKEILRTCTIITTVANPFMQELHHRMPLIMAPGSYADWLNPEMSTVDADKLLRSSSATELQSWQVSRLVNSPLNDCAELISALK